MTSNSEVLIAGGGIIGCSIAYDLSKAGVKVTIIERESVGSQASGAATGLLVALATADTYGPLYELDVESCKRHRELVPEVQDASGVDARYGELAWLEMAFTEEEEREMKSGMGWKTDSPDARWLSGEDIKRLEPRVTPNVRCGLYVGGQGQVDAYRLTLAFATAAERLGTTIRYGEVTGLKTQSGRVTGLNTSLGDMSGDVVVFALGSWSKDIEDWIGYPVPVEPLKGQTIQLEAPGPPLPCMLHHATNYVVPKVGGIVIAGTVDGFMGFDTTFHDDAEPQILRGVEAVCPGVMDSKVITHVTGLRPSSIDMLPILGPVPGLEGAYIATGHRRAGITLSAATAELMSQLILTGETRLSLEPFRLDRFDGVAETHPDMFDVVH